LPALLPFLIAEYHLSYAAAGFLVFATNGASTVVQPLFGHLPCIWTFLSSLGEKGSSAGCEPILFDH
jgi:hypothetical protein